MYPILRLLGQEGDRVNMPQPLNCLSNLAFKKLAQTSVDELWSAGSVRS